MLSPYRLAAATSLKKWSNLSEEEAIAKVSAETHDALENQVGANNSMKSAAKAINKILGKDWTKENADAFEKAVLGSDEPQMTEADENIIKLVAKNLDGVKSKYAFILAILSAVHDGWVIDNVPKFNKPGREGKKYQHLPIEMIGWNETKSDLDFVKPILDTLGIEYNETLLEEAYNAKVAAFFKKNDLLENNKMSEEKVAKAIEKGKEFYSPLTEGNTATPEDAALMAKQVKEKIAPALAKTVSME